MTVVTGVAGGIGSAVDRVEREVGPVAGPAHAAGLLHPGNALHTDDAV